MTDRSTADPSTKDATVPPEAEDVSLPQSKSVAANLELGSYEISYTVTEAVIRDLASIAKQDAALAGSALAASALALAKEMDDPSNSATSKSMCAKALLDTLDRLRELLPEKQEDDALDDLSARRRARFGSQEIFARQISQS